MLEMNGPDHPVRAQCFSNGREQMIKGAVLWMMSVPLVVIILLFIFVF